MISTFYLGTDSAENYGIIMTAPPDHVIAERDIERKEVPGRSGDVVIDNGRYKNITVKYSCAILPEDGVSFRTAVTRAVQFLKPGPAYQRLRNTYDPDSFREARIQGNYSVESIVEQAGLFEIEFDCKPQYWLLSGLETIDIRKSTTLSNPTNQAAKPIITVYGTGPGVLTVGGVQCRILELTDYITLDCETETARREIENKNSTVSIAEFPTLEGDTGISWDGGIEHIEIQPRWWTL
nr:MAG TPA: distal tail protein [Caudoviricetes sp.]